MRRRLLQMLAPTAAIAGLAACGSASDSATITQVIHTVGRDPATLCTRYGTAGLIRQDFGNKSQCLQQAKEPTASDPAVKVDRVAVTGSTATATIREGRGPKKGQPSTVRFVKQGGQWKVSGTSS